MNALDNLRALAARGRGVVLAWLAAFGAVYDALIVWWIERVWATPAWQGVRRTVAALRDWAGWRQAARLARTAWQAVWAQVGPPILDGLGWLRYRAPGAAWQGVKWLARRLPRWVWWLVSRAVIGAWWVLSRALRWASAYDSYAALVTQLRDDQRHGTAKRVREEWTRAAALRTVGLLVLAVVAAVLLAGVVDKSGPAVVVTAAVVAFALVGRIVRPTPAAPADDAPAWGEPGPDEPFPLADAHTRAEAADCVARALRAEGVELRMAGEAIRTRWGWEVPVLLRRGTPAAIVDRLPALETSLDLPAGGAMAAPDRTRRARVVMRLAERDPFIALPDAPRREPGSVSILDRLTVGGLITGAPLDLALAGVHGVVIGNTGAGKSMTLRTLADAVTACADAVAWDLDPAGVGLDPLAPVLGRIERTRAGIEDALADALALAEVRPHLMRELGMTGAEWNVSPEFPAIVVFGDEYSRLSPRAKELAVELLRIGRKARVSLILAASEATSDTLGDAIADTTALKILLPCRHADVRLVLGPAMLSDGWRPDRLNPASADSPEDAGCGYVHAAHYREPVLAKFRPLSDQDAAERTARRAAYRPRVDAVSRQAARARRANTAVTGRGGRGAAVVPLVDRMAMADVLAAFGTDERLWTVDLLARLADRDGRYAGWTPDDLADVLRPLGLSAVQIKQGGRNRNGYHRQAVHDALNGPSGTGRR